MKPRPQTCVMLVLILCGFAMLAQAEPNLSGEWVLNIEKSEFGEMPPPDSYTRIIEHKNPSIKISTTQVGMMGEMKNEITCTIGGDPCNSSSEMGESTSTFKWDGDTLVTDSTMEMMGMAMTGNETMTLSADGKTLTLTNSISLDMGGFEATYILEKK